MFLKDIYKGTVHEFYPYIYIRLLIAEVRIRHFFHGSRSGSAGKKLDPDPTLIRKEKRIFILCVQEVVTHFIQLLTI